MRITLASERIVDVYTTPKHLSAKIPQSICQHRQTPIPSTIAICFQYQKCHSSDEYSSGISKPFGPWRLPPTKSDATPRPACGHPPNTMSSQEQVSPNYQLPNTILARPACLRHPYLYPPLPSIVQPAAVSRKRMQLRPED